MKYFRKYLLFFLLTEFIPASLFATHIVGGEVYYRCLGGYTYRLTLKLYRDGCPSCYVYDHPTSIYIFNAMGNLVNELEFDGFDSIQVPPTINNPCNLIPPDVIVWGIKLDTVVYLPPSNGGYDVVYQRCCRNNTIINLISPGATGSTYLAHIPDPSTMCNSSPYFNKFPPIALCVGDSLKFDHSATDPDGDSLVYELCTPYEGATDFDPKPDPPPPPLYAFVNYNATYSSGYPIDASPPLSINPQTGFLTGTPTTIGQYVVAVCVYEYRNGQLIDVNKRDFQFNIVQCGAVITAAMPSYVLECDDYTVNFQNNSSNATYYKWNFGDGTPVSIDFAPSHVYTDTGTYIVTLIANPGWPCADTAYATVEIFPGLVPDFSFITGCAGTPIPFTDSSITLFGNIFAWYWTFGDGFTSAQQNPAHNYSAGGNYSVTLKVTNTNGCQKTITQNIFVYPVPAADFESTPPCAGDTMFFTDKTIVSSGNIILWSWNFNSEAVFSNQNPYYIFPDTGNYFVTLKVYSNYGCSDSIQKIVHVNPIPLSYAGKDTSICSFYTLPIGTPSTMGYSYLWSPSSGISNPTVSNPFVYIVNDSTTALPYAFTVRTESKGCISFDNITISVFPDIRAAIPHQPGQCLEGNSFNFIAGGVISSNAQFQWDFGNNANPQNSSYINPSGISFATEGPQLITLIIEDNGCFSTDSDTVLIYTVPVAGFALSVNSGCDPLTIQFNDTSITQSALSYLWDFGDGNFDTVANPIHTFTPGGVYNVTLIIILEQCKGFQSMSSSSTVTCYPAPVAGFTISPPKTSIFEPFIRFTDNSSGGVACTLYFGDGDSSQICETLHEYQDTGIFRVIQTVRTSYGCIRSDTGFVHILPEFTFFAPNCFTPNGDGDNDFFTPKGIGIALFEMYIFDRWGDEIFRTNNLYGGWNGIVNNGKKPAQEDVYVWRVNLVDVFEKEHHYIGRVAMIK